MYGFVAPPSEIIPSGQEIVDSLVAMFKAAAKYYPQLKRITFICEHEHTVELGFSRK